MEEWDVCDSIVLAKLAPGAQGTLHYAAGEVLDSR